MTRSKLNNKAFNQYLLKGIDSEAYDIITTTNTEKLAFLHDTFKKENGFMIPRVGYQTALCGWLQGLPSVINIEFMNHNILILGEKFGMVLNTEKKKDDFLNSWFNRCAFHLVRLMEKEGVL
jgi:hypothetical protein